MSFKLSNEADVRENDKDVQEIDIHLAEVLHLVDTFDFAPAMLNPRDRMMEPSSLVVIIPFSSRSNNEKASLYSEN